jgi:hypothetical protein
MHSMWKIIAASALLAACADQPDATYQRTDGETVPIEPCEDGDIMCLDILDANVTLAGTTVEDVAFVALLRGPFDDGSDYVYTGANLVSPEHHDDPDDSYGVLTRYPLTLSILPGQEQWHAGHLVQFTNAGTDGASIAPLCGTVVIAELSLGAPSQQNNGQPMSSTTWLKYATLTCH